VTLPCAEFFPWYNHEHHHSGLGYLTPHEVHNGLAKSGANKRPGFSDKPYERYAQRFVRGLPNPALLPTAAWINKPKEISGTESAEVTNSSMTDIEQKNGFHNCPITNDQPSGRGTATMKIR
jgi:hypothetical protein